MLDPLYSTSGNAQTPPVVLVVDDHEDTAKLLACMLREAGFLVEEAGSCQEGRRLLKEKRFDWAILDYNLPDGLGTDLAESLQATATRMVLFTGCAVTPGIVQNAVKAGIQTIFSKPGGARSMVNHIRCASAGRLPRR